MATLTAVINPTENQVANAQREAISRAEELARSITGVDGPDDALIREILPNEDLDTTGDNNWNGTDRDWIQSGLTADQTNDAYSINSNQNAQDKVIAIYGVANIAAEVLSTEIAFQDGTGATFARFNVEVLEIPEISDYIILDRPIVYGSTEDGTIVQWPDEAGADNMIYLAKVAEPLGNTLSTRERTERRIAAAR